MNSTRLFALIRFSVLLRSFACKNPTVKTLLRFEKSYRKEVLASLTIQAQATRKTLQEVAGLRTHKEVLARALF